MLTQKLLLPKQLITPLWLGPGISKADFVIAKFHAGSVKCASLNMLRFGFARVALLSANPLLVSLRAQVDGRKITRTKFVKVLTSVMSSVSDSRETTSAKARKQRRAAGLLHGKTALYQALGGV
ncbi:hypothetical protein BH18ACI4_BH18ACI4_01100 [soil metagenome]